MQPNIYLVRHGESEANVTPSLCATRADHDIGLSEKGRKQAEDVAWFLAKRIGSEHRIHRTRIWNSPYRRTVETAAWIAKAFDQIGRPYDQRENIALCEQQFGLFDGLSDEEARIKHPHEWECYNRAERHEGRFWARYPQGESRFDVALRVHQAFGTFIRDRDAHGIDNLIIVTHGVTLRAFVMQWKHYTWKWMEEQKNPPNCGVWYLNSGSDMGLIYPPESEKTT